MQQMDRDGEKKRDSNPHPNSLLDKQLEEILRNAERTHQRQLFWRRLRETTGAVAGGVTPGRRRKITPGRLMAWGVGCLLAAILLARFIPAVSTVLMVAGVVLFFFAVLRASGSGSSPPDQRVWRGRVIEYPEGDPLETVRRWFRRLRGGPPGP